MNQTYLQVLATTALLCGMWATPKASHAYESQATLGVDLAHTQLVADSLPELGAGVGVAGSWGLGPAWTAKVRASGAYLPRGDASAAAALFGLGPELYYVLDVVTWVPFLGFGVDGLLFHGETDTRVDVGAHLVAGVDYLWSRRWTFGFEVRPTLVPTALGSRGFFLSAGIRLSRVFELY